VLVELLRMPLVTVSVDSLLSRNEKPFHLSHIELTNILIELVVSPKIFLILLTKI